MTSTIKDAATAAEQLRARTVEGTEVLVEFREQISRLVTPLDAASKALAAMPQPVRTAIEKADWTELKPALNLVVSGTRLEASWAKVTFTNGVLALSVHGRPSDKVSSYAVPIGADALAETLYQSPALFVACRDSLTKLDRLLAGELERLRGILKG